MVHRISKTKELPGNKMQTFYIESEAEAEQIAKGSEAWLLPVKDGFYLFVAGAA